VSNSIKNRCVVCCFEFEVPLKKRNQKTCSKDCSYKLRFSVRNTKHEPVEKTCKECSQIFQDTSKKKLVETCIDCVHIKMVNTRKERGSYERTEDQNEKLSRTLKKKYELGWNPNTEEHRAKLSKIMKEAWASGDFSKKSKETCIRKYGTLHWMKSEKAYKMLVKRIETSWARQGFRTDLKKYFRSSWEANFARICDFEGRKWKYEPEFFMINNETRYTPDFLVEDTYYEIKGYDYPTGKEKIKLFREKFKHIKFELIDSESYKKLEKKYKDLIKEWER